MYCSNNPVMFVDPSGLAPTPEEAALMAEHIYKHRKDDQLIHRKVEDTGWRLIDIWQEFGSVMGIYIRWDAVSSYDGPVEYVLAFRGTDSLVDWDDNLLQPIGASKDMAAAITMARAFVKAFGEQEITFVGHSKGGAEAISSAVETNRNAIVFNSAVPAVSKYVPDWHQLEYTGHIRHYSVYGEAISNYLGVPNLANPNAIETISIPTQIPIGEGWREFPDRVANHHMQVIIEAFRKKAC